MMSFDWSKATPEELKQFAKDEGLAFEKTKRSDLDKMKWEFIPRFPVARFLRGTLPTSYSKPKSWVAWFNTECAGADDDGKRFRGLEKAWTRKPEDVGPIVAVEMPDGAIDIGDGYHRVGISFKHNLQTVPVVLGKKMKKAIRYKGAVYVGESDLRSELREYGASPDDFEDFKTKGLPNKETFVAICKDIYKSTSKALNHLDQIYDLLKKTWG